MDVRTSRFCLELGLLNGRHFDVVRLEEDAYGSSVYLLPIPLACHCCMLNVLSDMVGVWAGLDGGKGVRGCGGVIQAVQIQTLALR